jgi:hypothetical protein
MKITLVSPSRLELTGTPQGRGLAFGMAVCLGIAVVAGLFVYHQWSTGSPWGAVMPGVGGVFMLGIFAVLVLHSFRRERLVLDRSERRVEYSTWSLLWGSRKTKAYAYEKIHAVSVQKTLQAPGGGKGFPTTVYKARLLFTRPRRAIDLDEIQGGKPDEAVALAREVAGFLGVEVKVMDFTGEEDDARRPSDANNGEPAGRSPGAEGRT